MSLATGGTLTLTQRDRRFGYLLTAPGLAVLVVVVTFPLFFTVFTSFYDYTLLTPNHETFIGGENYQEAAEEEYLPGSLWVTVKFVLASVVIEFIIGFIVALALNATNRFKTIYYLILLAPLLINPVVVGLLWRMLLHSELGIVNYAIGLVGIRPVSWLGDPTIAFWTVVLTDIWHQVSFMAILLLAGLSALPREPYEAAQIDGAGPIRTFVHVTFPLMAPITLGALIIRLIESSKLMETIYALTSGGPGSSTETTSYLLYIRGLREFQIGYTASLSIIYLVIMIVALTIFARLLSRLMIGRQGPVRA
jgi:multiple sugar transport system permease protein